MQEIIHLKSKTHQELIDITPYVTDIVQRSKVFQGVVNVYAQGTTSGVMIQENRDENVQYDVVTLLNKMIPHGSWLHDEQDGNGDAHLKAGIVGNNECIPIVNGRMGLSPWQNIYFCEFDGPREKRDVVVTVLNAI